jgi:ABC-type cobalamin/Fe3+-siderophores transport system ATPase subunit
LSSLFEIEAVSFSYGRKRVVESFSLALDSGVFYGILGPNGCGKSTLIDLMLSHRRPEAGRIRYKGRDLFDYSRQELAREIALVPQNFYINFPFTAREVVMMGRYPRMPRFCAPSPHDHDRVEAVMAQTQTLAFKDRYVTQLSGGERQRVVFARSLAQDTPVLMLDEATSNLDINHAISVLRLAVQRVDKADKTVIAVMQDINLAAMFCDYLIFMDEGKVLAHGPVADSLTSENLDAVFHVASQVQFEPYASSLQVVFKK